MLTPKKCIDKTMHKIIKQLRLPEYIKNHLTYYAERTTTEFCYRVFLDNVPISNIPMDLFYTQPINIIKNRIDQDLEQHVLKVYAKQLTT